MSPLPPPSTELLPQDAARNAPLGCVLYVAEGPEDDRGKSATLSGGSVRIGSAEGCQLLLADPAVSRLHATVTALSEGLRVEDHGSKNGVLYLGNRVERMTLQPGARIQVGRCMIDLLRLDDGQHAAIASTRTRYGELVGTSAPMRRLYGMLERIEQTAAPVLIEGPTGTGKELTARAIHNHSARKDKSFVVVDCGTMSAELARSSLFGHRRGSFTGAHADQPGAFEAASGGTIFLDEIGELPLELQPQLLRVLETGQVQRIGDSDHNKVDVRVVAATHRDLERDVAAGRFREDLFYRLAVIRLSVPALALRPDDIVTLAHYLAEQMAGVAVPDFPDTTKSFMRSYSWPGNVRELRNAVQRLLAIGTLGITPTREVAPSPPPADTSLGFKEAKQQAVQHFESAYLQHVLKEADNNISAAARRAGIDRKHFRDLLKRHGLYDVSADQD